MTTKPSRIGIDLGIYSSPFDAFTNYMNILGDFITRVNNLYPAEIGNEELESLLTTIKNQGDELAMKDKEIVRLQAKIEKIEDANKKEGVKEPKAKKPSTSKKPVAKKPTNKSKKSVEEQKKDKK